MKIDLKNGRYQYGVLTGDVNFVAANLPPEGYVGEIVLELKQDEVGKHEIKFSEECVFYGEPPTEFGKKSVIFSFISNRMKK